MSYIFLCAICTKNIFYMKRWAKMDAVLNLIFILLFVLIYLISINLVNKRICKQNSIKSTVIQNTFFKNTKQFFGNYIFVLNLLFLIVSFITIIINILNNISININPNLRISLNLIVMFWTTLNGFLITKKLM